MPHPHEPRRHVPKWKANAEETVTTAQAAETFLAVVGQIAKGTISLGGAVEVMPAVVDAIVRIEDTPHHTRVMLAIEWERSAENTPQSMRLSDLGLTGAVEASQ